MPMHKVSYVDFPKYGISGEKQTKSWLSRTVRERSGCDLRARQDGVSPFSVQVPARAPPYPKLEAHPDGVKHTAQLDGRETEASPAVLFVSALGDSQDELDSPPRYCIHDNSHGHKRSRAMWLTADEVKPIEIDEINAIERALREMAACRTTFTNWKYTLNDLNLKQMPELDLQLRVWILSLEKQACDALAATESIVRTHRSFTMLVAERLQLAASTGTLSLTEDISCTAGSIESYSKDASRRVDQMMGTLRELVTQVEAAKAKLKKKPIWKKICTLLAQIFQAVATLAAVASMPVGPLSSSASVVRGAFASAYADNRIPQSLDEIFKFLSAVPGEAEHAEQRIHSFAACHRVLQLNTRFERGEQIRMVPSEAERASMEWEMRYASLQLLPARAT